MFKGRLMEMTEVVGRYVEYVNDRVIVVLDLILSVDLTAANPVTVLVDSAPTPVELALPCSIT